MPETTGRFRYVAKLSRVALAASLALLFLVVIATILIGILRVPEDMPWTYPAGLALIVLGELLTGLWLFVMQGVIRVIVSHEFTANSTDGLLKRIESLLADQGEAAKKLIELASLSDQAKSLIHRDQELEAMRGVIREDMIRQDYRTASALIETIEANFGYADEAARLRDELEASKKATLEEKIDAAVARIQQIIDQRTWPLAIRESRRIIRLFPDNPKIAALPERIEAARTKHKRELLQAYGEAVRKNDVDHSIELLKELDLYLTPQEAAALQESARGVFKAKLHNLGVRFAISVTDQQWEQAVSTGEEIIREFPNSRMATEVREKLDLMRSRVSGEQQPAE